MSSGKDEDATIKEQKEKKKEKKKKKKRRQGTRFVRDPETGDLVPEDVKKVTSKIEKMSLSSRILKEAGVVTPARAKRRNKKSEKLRLGQVQSQQSATASTTDYRGAIESDSENSDLDVVTATNEDLIVSTRRVKTARSGREVVLFSITNSRPDTHLGKEQGDHVTAYQSFVEMLITASEGYGLKDVYQLILNVAGAIMPGKKGNFTDLKKEIEADIAQSLSRDDRSALEELFSVKAVKDALEKIIGTDKEKTSDSASTSFSSSDTLLEKAKAAHLRDRKQTFMNAITKAGQAFISEINLDEEIAFRRIGKRDRAEGARVKKAIHALRVANEISRIIDETNEKHVNSFMERYLFSRSRDQKYTDANPKDGANDLFGGPELKKIQEKWDEKSFKEKKETIKGLKDGINGQKIAGYVGDLFDYKYEKHRKSGISIVKVTAKHLVIMFNAFDKLKDYGSDVVINCFLKEKVLEEQEWKKLKVFSGAPLTRDVLLGEVKKEANFIEGRMKTLAEKEREKGRGIT